MSILQALFGKKSPTAKFAEFLPNTVKCLRHQLGGVDVEALTIHKPYTLGYITGCGQAMAQAAGYTEDSVVSSAIHVVYRHVFGDTKGAEMSAASSRFGSNDKDPETYQAWMMGRTRGRWDMEGFFSSLKQSGSALAPDNLAKFLRPSSYM